MGTPTYVGIDWGTSNRRAYAFDADGACLRRLEDGEGMLAARGRFPEALGTLLACLGVPASTPVLMSGMVGSAQGWREVPYLDPCVPLPDLPAHLFALDDGRFIVPGYRQHGGQAGIPDVMRGEETQLLGLVLEGMRDGWVVLPGTHSKWVLLEDGCIARWSTYMTGELFAMLSRQGTLAPLLEGGADVPQAFEDGLDLARRRLPLSNALFSLRAAVVTGSMPLAHARSMASGLLIGAEFAEMAAGGHAAPGITLLASSALCGPYRKAAAAFGINARLADAHAMYAGALHHLYQEGIHHVA